MGEIKKVKVSKILAREEYEARLLVPDYISGILSGFVTKNVKRVKMEFIDDKFGIKYTGFFTSTEEPKLGDHIHLAKPGFFSEIRDISYVLDDRKNRFDVYRGTIPKHKK